MLQYIRRINNDLIKLPIINTSYLIQFQWCNFLLIFYLNFYCFWHISRSHGIFEVTVLITEESLFRSKQTRKRRCVMRWIRTEWIWQTTSGSVCVCVWERECVFSWRLCGEECVGEVKTALVLIAARISGCCRPLRNRCVSDSWGQRGSRQTRRHTWGREGTEDRLI